ncbi:hypothetical protein B879_03433 [Cecembia lonarensis LW9]|uniref:Uncharacterized protein n=1 Tax=Cecembia lonarensis (strain CCUG 58316 / KCTC 22772 / LW9) TaxID=1225176 RepID=K1L779_CECL9|nr:hypothetical protein B879_03433 [Cecembia lonarensis LW9]
MLAFCPALLQVNFLRFGDMGTATMDQMAILVIVLNDFLKMPFYTTQVKRLQKLSIRQLGQSIIVACNPRKFFYMAVPWGQVFITNGPINGISVSGRPFKVQIRPSLRLSGPKQRLPSHLISPCPLKRLFLYSLLFPLLHPKMGR